MYASQGMAMSVTHSHAFILWYTLVTLDTLDALDTADLEIVVDPGSPTPSDKLGWQKVFD